VASNASQDKYDAVCTKYAAGYCKFGENCAFKHEGNSGSADAIAPKKSSKMCAFFLAGNCRFPEACTFSHDPATAESAPPKKATKLCSFFAAGNCGYGENCTFSHDPSAVASNASQDKYDAVCTKYAAGYCKFGENCAFKHEGNSGGGGGWGNNNGGGGWKSNSGDGWGDNGKDGDWSCPKCYDNQFAKNTRCRKCGTPRPGAELDPESELLEKYIDAVKKWQRVSPDNQPTWQKYCDSNDQYGKYDPRRKDLAFLQQFAKAHGIPSPDPAGEAALGGSAAAPAAADTTPTANMPDMTDPNVIAQMHQLMMQQALLQQQQALLASYMEAGASQELALQLVTAFYAGQKQSSS